MKEILIVCSTLFVFYLLGYASFLFCSVVVGTCSLYKIKRYVMMKNILLKEEYYIPISIIVPAYNEEVTIIESIESLLKQEYSKYEIIVVDDGSNDSTVKILKEYYSMQEVNKPINKQVPCKNHKRIYEAIINNICITLVEKENGGKADALNMGINICHYPYFICMDADSILQYDALFKIMQPLLFNKDVVAVGGMIRMSNDVIIKDCRIQSYQLPKNILACMQVLEYERTFLASRILFDLFNGSFIISGAFGLFKKETVILTGGYDVNTMGEDMELCIKLHDYCKMHNMSYSIRYAFDAICYTQAPESLKDLLGQRKRWHLGLFQCMYKYRRMFLNIRYGILGFISYSYFILYELLSPIIELLGILVSILCLHYKLINISYMIMFFMIYALFGCIITLTAFFSRMYTSDLTLKFKDILKALLLCLFELTILRFILSFQRVIAFINYKNRSWGKIKRKKITHITS